MSKFEVLVRRIIEPVKDHPNADRLSIIKIDGFECISAKLENGTHRYHEGDLVVYIPEAAVLPEYLLKSLGFWDETKNKGTLNGPEGNRVKAVKLRGVLSQGVLMGVTHFHIVTNADGEALGVKEGDDVGEFLGIVKYEPPIPASLAGSVTRIPHPGTFSGGDVIYRYDFENIQKVSDMFDEGERVVITEKLHGTFCQIGMIPGLNHEQGFGDWFVASKGLGKQGLCFQNLPENTNNVYVKTLRNFMEKVSAEALMEITGFNGPMRIFGEIFGGNIQDLNYGLSEPEFKIFDVLVDQEFWLKPHELAYFCDTLGIKSVPILAEGGFTYSLLEEYRDGKTTLGGHHIREGIVIKSYDNFKHPKYGRKIAKAISPNYLTRKDGTEYN